MSRRSADDEFARRTLIFEGSYRAWSHFGGCDTNVLRTTSPMDQDPFANLHDPSKDPMCSKPGAIHDFPYEPLPRSGLAHPFVQVILGQWLGPTSEQKDTYHQGLATLRIWWQHRRRGESVSAKTVLSTPKMNSVLKGHTKYFFKLAYYMVVNYDHQPPRTLCRKLQIKEKNNIKSGKRVRENDALKIAQQAMNNKSGEEAISAGGAYSSSSIITLNNVQQQLHPQLSSNSIHFCSTPIVHISSLCTSDITIVMDITGISCYTCIRIIEFLLTGDNFDVKSPIDGIVDAVADFDKSRVLIKIDAITSAKMISDKVTDTLKMVGYVAKAREIKVDDIRKYDFLNYMTKVNTSFQMKIKVEATKYFLFDWTRSCVCPAFDILPLQCSRHQQLNKEDIFEIIEELEKFIIEQEEIVMGLDMRMMASSMDNSASLGPKLKQHPDHDSTVVSGSITHHKIDQSLAKLKRSKKSGLTDDVLIITGAEQLNTTTSIFPSIQEPQPSQVSIEQCVSSSTSATTTKSHQLPCSASPVAASGLFGKGQPPYI